MSEVQSRPGAPRGGRGAGRGGRGGFSRASRNQNRNAATNGDSKHDPDDKAEDQGLAELKQRHGAKTSLIKEMFPEWSEADILFALEENNGDENLTVTRIAEGTTSQWGEVTKTKKERTKVKGKENTFTTTTGDAIPASNSNSRPARGGRSGPEGARGRGRSIERGGRASRGKSVQGTNGARAEKNHQLSVPTDESNVWDAQKTDNDTVGWGSGSWDATPAATTTSSPDAAAASVSGSAVGPKTTSIIPEGTQKTWASMLRQSTVPKPATKPKEPSALQPADTIDPLTSATEPSLASTEPIVEDLAEPADEAAAPEVSTVIIPEIALPPSKDQLTETNVEQIADASEPPPTETTRSEAADSWDPRISAVGTVTPLSASQMQHQAVKPPASGYAATAIKATERIPTRIPSYTRRILDQEEPVRMPVNRDVDRTTVQFGALNFSGIDDDIDGDREDPETRAQPPDDSPIAHPRTSLPPIPQPAQVPETFPTQKPSAALPPTAGPAAVVPPPASQQPVAVTQATQPTGQNAQFGRYGAGSQDQPFSQKPFDSFGQQNQPSSVSSQYEGFQAQQHAQAQPHAQQPGGAFSSAPSEFSNYYTADQQGRTPYNYYNQNYGQQQSGQASQEGGAHPQRSFGSYNAPQNDNLSQYPQSGASRYGTAAVVDVQNSGSTTPNPPAQGQQNVQAGQAQQSHGQQPPHNSQYPGYGASHPYFSSPYYSNYMNHGYQAFGQGAFGGPYGKGAYGQHPYPPYDHSSSQVTGFSQSSLHRGDSGLASGLGEFGRAASGQSGNQPGLGGSGFGNVHEGFGRGGSSYQSQAGQSFGAQSSQQGAVPSGPDELKPFADAKNVAGPSPSIGGARPGSATNTNPTQSGLPPPQSNPQGGVYGNYPSHLQGHGLHSNQSGAGGYGMGAGAGQQSHGNTPYGGGYGGQAFGGSYYGNQQQRGWGNNYH